MPVYFQAVLGSSPIRSGVQTLATSLVIAPFALFAGVGVQVIKNYRGPNLIGWVMTIIGFGVLSMLDIGSSEGKYIGYQIPLAVGLGIVVSPTRFLSAVS